MSTLQIKLHEQSQHLLHLLIDAQINIDDIYAE